MEKYTGKPVGFGDVEVTGGFWKKKQELVERVTIGAVFKRFEETGRNGCLDAGWKEGMPFRPHIFWESDVTKWIEGAADFLRKHRDAALEEQIDILVDRMEKAQDENGYLNAYFTAVEPEARFTRRTDHELYCAGHLIEGAIAYCEATGKRKMLDIAIRYADLIDRVFRIEHSASFDTPGHEEIELALFKLYRYTGEERYRMLAEYFLNTRGTSERDGTYSFADLEHMQSHLPVRRQRTAEGHSVRALYLYSAMADMALLEKEDELADVCSDLFENIVNRRMYITGGVGSTHRGESFSYDYDLPEYTAYNETCASIALAFFCRRLWLIRADRRYADCAELALYNTVLSGLSLSGDEFFYENPLAVDPRRTAFNDSRAQGLREHLPILQRVKVFSCSCCPPNLIRAIGAIGDYMYSFSGDTVYAQCYMNADAEITLGARRVVLRQRTEYPYDGNVRIRTETDGDYTVALRIPSWCDAYTVHINGEEIPAEAEDGYVLLARTWSAGDEIVLDMVMEVKLIEGNPQVPDLCGRAAFTRGPLTFCAEGVDMPGVQLRDIRVGNAGEYAVLEETVAGERMPVLEGKAYVRPEFTELYRPCRESYREITLRLIPYHAWANRGECEMTVWFLKKS